MCKSLLPKCREECLPSASVQGWLLPTWLSEVTEQPINIQRGRKDWEVRDWEEKVASETRRACLLPFTSLW